MGKRIKTIKEIKFQGTTIPSGTIGQYASGTDDQISPSYLQGQSFSNGQELVLSFNKGAGVITLPIAMEQLATYVTDVAVNTPLTSL